MLLPVPAHPLPRPLRGHMPATPAAESLPTDAGPMTGRYAGTWSVFVPAVILGCSLGGAAHAADTPSSANAATLSTVEVSAQATPASGAPAVGARGKVTLDASGLPSSVTTITQEELSTINVGRDMSSVFRRVPGVLANNIDQGDTGNGFRMRGFATQGTHGADTAVYVDGVPQNIPSSQGGAGHGPVFLEWLTPEMISRIDVIKGPISALYGDQNRAGAVGITTASGGLHMPSSIGVTLESYGGKRTSLVLSNQFKEVDSLFVADIYRNDGFRDASRTERDNFFWKLSTQYGDGIYSLRASHYRSESQAAGYLLLPDLERGLDPRSTQFNFPGFGDARRSSLVFNRTPVGGEAGWYATAYAEDFERTRGITTSPVLQTVGYDDRRMFGGRLARNFAFDKDASLFVGADVRRDSGDALRRIYSAGVPTANYVNNQDLDLLTYGVFAQAQYKPVDSLKLLAGVRHDRFDYDIDNRKLPAASTTYRNGVTTPKVGAVWSVQPRLDLFANVAQGFRSPAAEQISSSGSTGPLGAQGGLVSSIAPSKVKSYDVGFTANPTDNWSVSGAAYYTLNDDEIVLQSDGSFKSVGDTTRKGVELESRYRLDRQWSVYGSYGRILQAKVNNPAANTGAKLSVPVHQLKVGTEYRTAMGQGSLTFNADAYLISGIPYYVGTPQTRERTMPVYTRYDLRATYELRQTQFSLYGILQPNRYGSEIAYGTSAGLLVSPMPHAQIGASVRYTF